MSDTVKIIFDADLGSLQQKKNAAKAELESFAAEAQSKMKGVVNVGAPVEKGFEFASGVQTELRRNLSDTQKQALALNTALLQVKDSGMSGLIKATAPVKAELDQTRRRLAEIDALSRKTGDPALLRGIDAEVRALSADIDVAAGKLNRLSQRRIAAAEAAAGEGLSPGARFGRINLARQGADVFTQLGSGQGLGIVAVQQGPQIIDALAFSGFNLSKALTAAGSSWLALGAAAAAGAVAIGAAKIITDEIRLSEERNTRAVEKGAIEYGRLQKAIFDAKQEAIDFARQREKTEAGRQFDKSTEALIDRRDVSSLQQQISSLEKRREALKSSIRLEGIYNKNPAQKALDEEQLKIVTDQILNLDAAVAKTRDSARKLLNPSPDEQSTAAITKYRQQIKEAGEDIQKLRGVLADAGRNPVLSSKDREALTFDLSKQIEENIKAAKEKVKGLVKGFKAEFENLYIGSVGSTNPFATQMLQNAKAVEELKEKLAGVTPELRKTALGLLETANAQKTYTLQINNAFETIDLRAQAERFRNPTQAELQRDFNRKLEEFRRTSNSTNPDVIRGFQREQAEINAYELQRKLRIIDEKLDVSDLAKTPAERAIADRAVINFSNSLNPDELSRSDRSRIADAYDRAAVRNESRQEEALKIQQDLLKTLQAIDKRGETLTNIANEKGKAGIDAVTKVDITLKDDTSDKKVTATSATTTDVSDTYRFPIAGSGGSNL